MTACRSKTSWMALLAGALLWSVGPVRAGRAQPPPAAPPPPPALEAAPAAGAATPELAPPTAQEGVFHYDPSGRRDPFKSLLILETKKRDLSQLPPIQQFDIEQVTIIGVVLDEAQGSRAMIRAPNGQSYVVKKGTIIGKNEGEVVEVTLAGIRVVEKFVDFMNKETRKETFIKTRPTVKFQ